MMPTKHNAAKRSTADIEAQITQQVIDRLKEGVAPWRKPWSTAGWMPTSVATGKAYRGINSLILALVAEQKGYTSPLWLTFNQAKALGGRVRKGEKSTMVAFWKVLDRTEDVDGVTETRKIPMLRYYMVFNVEQCDDLTLPARFTRKREPVEPEAGVAAVVAGYADGPTVRHVAQGRAFYVPATDTVTLPVREQFATASGYAGTVFHELVHSTGHPSRLGRFEAQQAAGPFGCQSYAKEELVAEMGAALLGAVAGIEVDLDQSASYVASWLKALEDDRGLIIKAAQAAQKAVDRIAPDGVSIDDDTDADATDAKDLVVTDLVAAQ
jgi:antirestriction protein ArdC